jgi:hypothetical protein
MPELSSGTMKMKPGDYMATTWVFFGQNLKAGDGIRTHPQMPAIPVVAVEPGRVIVLHGDTRAGPLGVERVERPHHPDRALPAGWESKLVITLANRCLLEPASFIMERKM